MGHKSLIALTFLIFTTQVFSMAPLERSTIQDEIFDYNQHGKIKAVMLNQIDSEIASTRDFFQSELANLGEPYSLMEGKIRASIIDSIRIGLIDVQEIRTDLEEIQDLTDADVAPITNKLKNINVSIEDLKI